MDVVDVGAGVVAAEHGGEEEVVGGGGGAGSGVRGGAHAGVDVDGLGEHAGLGVEVEEGVEVGFGGGESKGKGEDQGGDGVHVTVEAGGAEALHGGEEGGVVGGEAAAVAVHSPGEEVGAQAGVREAGEGIGEVGS